MYYRYISCPISAVCWLRLVAVVQVCDATQASKYCCCSAQKKVTVSLALKPGPYYYVYRSIIGELHIGLAGI